MEKKLAVCIEVAERTKLMVIKSVPKTATEDLKFTIDLALDMIANSMPGGEVGSDGCVGGSPEDAMVLLGCSEMILFLAKELVKREAVENN